MSTFTLRAPFSTTPPQREAAQKLIGGLKQNEKFQTLLGVTGSGKTFVMSQIIQAAKRPALIISHNKTLAAQLYQECKEFFPNNAVHYFVSYYDYYQPEAYIPASDTYIEKDAKINEELDRLRHAATQDLLSRNDVIVIASVSCIYNIGDPETYKRVSFSIKEEQKISQKNFLRRLVALGYIRNDSDFLPGTFRVRGNRIDIFLVTGQEILGVEFSRDSVASLIRRSPGRNFKFKSEVYNLKSAILYPAHFWVTPENQLALALQNVRLELDEQTSLLKREHKETEARRLQKRTRYDLSLMEETGYCHGIENYSRHLEFRKPGDSPFTLLDYFPKKSLIFVDESHMTVPQLRGMIFGDRARKISLIEYGFRLPSAYDNRPLTYEEFLEKTGGSNIIFVSATPNEYEKKISSQIVELLVRPTGLLEPAIEVRPTKNQLQDALSEIKKRIQKKQRVLITTITKKIAEDLAEYLRNEHIKTHFLHSEVKTLERPSILSDLRIGHVDVVVGVNLLREGLDLPEVSLIIIFDADKEGFLRSETTILQTMGRAARHPDGRIIMYADTMTGSMKRAIKEAARRRKIQTSYNKTHHISPSPIKKEVRPWLISSQRRDRTSNEELLRQDVRAIEREMKKAAKNLDFEKAAELKNFIQNVSSRRKDE